MKNIRQKFLENSSSNQKLFLTRSRIFFLLLFFCSVSLMAQNGVVVKGKVLDANDEPLIGAAIVLKTRVRDKDCVKNRVKRAKIVRFTLC